MRAIKFSGGAASIEGDVVILTGTQPNSDEVVRVELPIEMIQAISTATKVKTTKKGGTDA